MKWIRALGRWGMLGVSVAALAGMGVAGKQWAEEHALAAVLGEGARSDALDIHWGYAAGCADNVHIPLSSTSTSHSHSYLAARRMWFTYDVPALLRKRVVLPRVIIEEAQLVSSAHPLSSSNASEESPASADAKPPVWLDELHTRTDALENERFISGTQVAVDAAMLGQQWQASFADVHSRALRVLTEARDIQQELAAMDNPLRHEARVVASRGRLEELKSELAGLKNSLHKTDKLLRDQQSHIREALLIEKRALQQAAVAVELPPAAELAERSMSRWLAASMSEPTHYCVLLSNLIATPLRNQGAGRGENIHHVDPVTAQFAARSTKIAGEISIVGDDLMPTHSAPFTASGAFEVLPCAGNNESGTATAQWQMSVGRSLKCISLEGHSRDARGDVVVVELDSTAPGQVAAKCDVSRDKVVGTAEVHLRQWLAEGRLPASPQHVASNDPLVCELLEDALGNLENVPELVEFHFSNQQGVTQVELPEQAYDWLAKELARAASARVAKQYDSAVERLESHVVSELEAMNRAVAVSFNTESQHLQQLLQELKMLQADVMNNLAQRAGSEFARKSASDSIKR